MTPGTRHQHRDVATDAPRIVIAPDSYKGSARAADVAEALAAGLAEALAHARLIQAPMADGGEGTLDCVAAAVPGQIASARVPAIHGGIVEARWYRSDDNRAFVESAEVLGLPLIDANNSASHLRARGSAALGALVRETLNHKAHEVVIGLGGSACNDAGLGLLIALGARATDRHGAPVAPTLDGLLALDALDLSGLDPRLADTPIQVLCDVDNPLLGARGASRVYGPQKGLTESDIDAVEAAFERLATRSASQGLAHRAGSGAAGGLGFALALLGARLQPGADTLIDMTGLRTVLAGADLVITGEGRSDVQTLAGKLPLAIARAGTDVPAVLVSGSITDDARDALEQVFVACRSLSAQAGSVEAALCEPLRWLHSAGHDIGAAWPHLVDKR